MEEKKSEWISPHLIAGYGTMTFAMYQAMKQVAMAFENVSVAGSSGFVRDWGEIAGSDLFVPAVCALSIIPLTVHIASHIRRKWTVKARWFRNEEANEPQTDWARQLVDPGWQDKIQPLDMVSATLDTSLEGRGCDELRQDSIPQVGVVVPFENKARKSRKTRNR